MATRIRNGQTRTTETSLLDGDRLLVDAGGAIVLGGVSPAVRLSGSDLIVTNFGRIAVEGASGAALTGTVGGALAVRIFNGATGVIEGDSVAIALASATGTTGETRLVNAGLIDGNASFAVNFRDLRADSITIVNRAGGTITNGGTSDVVRPGHDLLTAIRVDNSGDIVAGTVIGAAASGDAIDLQSQDGGISATIVNRGTGLIEGGKHGVTGGNEAVIVNEAGGNIIGRNGSGLNFDTESADGDGAVTVKNFGLISGQYAGFGDGDGDGVDVDYLVNVRNFGRIEGIGADNIDDFGDGIAAGGGVIENGVGGEIFGETHGILIDDGNRLGAFAATRLVNDGAITSDLGTTVRLIGDFNDTIVNSGTIATGATLAIETGAGDDVVLSSGTITGNVLLGDGNDIYKNSGTTAGVVDGGAGDDRLDGGDDSDTLIGGAGSDVLIGGAGDDMFVFTAATDSNTTLGLADRITDFASGDRIDLTAIDADSATPDDQAFTLIGGAAFSNTAGELRVVATGDNTSIFGDIDGNGAADFAIVLVGTIDPSTMAFDL